MAKMMKKAQDGYTSYGAKAGTPSPVTDYAGKAVKQDSYTQYKKGGVIKKKAQNGMVNKIKASWNKAGEDLKQADRDYKSSDSLRKAPITGKTVKEKLDQMRSNRAKADSLYNVAKKREAGEMKKGGMMKKKAKSGGSFPDLNHDGKITKADILKGRGVIAKKGAKMKMGGAMAKQAATAIAMKKAGKKPKSMMQYGGKSASMAPMMKKGGKAMGKCKYGC
jgi:hypothetical protein